MPTRLYSRRRPGQLLHVLRPPGGRTPGCAVLTPRLPRTPGLHALGAQHRPCPAAAEGARLAEDPGEGHTALPRRPDGQGAHFRAEALLHPGLGLGGALAQHRGGVVEAHPPVLNKDKRPVRRAALQHDAVEAGELQLRPQEASGVAVQDPVGERALGHDAALRVHGGQGPGQRAHGQDQLVFRGQGIRARGHFVGQELHPVAHAPQVVGQPRRHRPGAGAPGGQVHPQQVPPHAAVHGLAPLPTASARVTHSGTQAGWPSQKSHLKALRRVQAYGLIGAGLHAARARCRLPVDEHVAVLIADGLPGRRMQAAGASQRDADARNPATARR
jgi:hypothetical protein